MSNLKDLEKIAKTQLIPLQEKLNIIFKKKNSSYKAKIAEIVDEMSGIFCYKIDLLKTSDDFIQTYNKIFPYLIYLCEENEKFLFPQIIFPLAEKIIDKFEENLESKNIVYDKHNLNKDYKLKIQMEVNYNELCIKFFHLIFIIILLCKENFYNRIPRLREELNKLKKDQYEIQKSIERNVFSNFDLLNLEEKKNFFNSFLKVENLKYSNIFYQAFILLMLKREKDNSILLKENYGKLISIFDNVIQKLKNINTVEKKEENIYINIFNIFFSISSLKEIIKDFYKINSINKIINIKLNDNYNSYTIIEQKNENNYLCQNILDKNEIIIEKIDFEKYQDKNEISLYKKNMNKEISLKKFIYDLNKSALKVYEYVQSDEKIIVMKELYDLTLEDILSSKIKMTVNNIKQIFRQINITLYLLISNNIKNLLINPKNILIKYIDKDKNRFEAKLEYYSFLYDMTPSEFLTLDNNININILAYLAPEYFTKSNKNENLEKADLFSIGVILYFLSIGKYPFGNNVNDIKNKIKNNEDKFIFENVLIDNNLKDLIINLLKFDPNKRLSWSDYFKHKFFQIKFDNNGNLID